jgi:penicillin V acylase-like amidase (Ntn superfamily)
MKRVWVFVIGWVLLGNAFACTTFCLDTPRGPVFGANLDFFVTGEGLVFINQRGIAKSGFQKSTTGERIEWVSTYGSVSFNLAGREFAWGGMNEAGLVIGCMELLAGKFPEPDERPALSMGTWEQYVLDTCATIDEVIALDKIVRIEESAAPAHFLSSDADGNCVSIEFFEGKLLYRRGDDLPVKAMTNSTYDESLATFKKGGPRWWERDRGQTRRRFSTAAKRNLAYPTSGETNAIKYAFYTLARDVAAGHTKWNIVYNIPERAVWFRSVQSPAVKHLSLMDFDLSADTPLLMLDINAPIEGDVKEAFGPFDFNTNLTAFRNLCNEYGIEISADDALSIMQHFETFSKAEGQ